MYPCTWYKFYGSKNLYEVFSFENVYKGLFKNVFPRLTYPTKIQTDIYRDKIYYMHFQ